MVKRSPLYVLNIDENTSYEKFRAKITDNKVKWKSDNNLEDPDGVVEIEKTINEIASNLDDESKWKLYLKSLDAALLNYQKLGSIGLSDWELDISRGKDKQISKNYEDIFIPLMEFPDLFVGINRKTELLKKKDKKQREEIKKALTKLREIYVNTGKNDILRWLEMKKILKKFGVDPNDEEAIEEFIEDHLYLIGSE